MSYILGLCGGREFLTSWLHCLEFSICSPELCRMRNADGLPLDLEPVGKVFLVLSSWSWGRWRLDCSFSATDLLFFHQDLVTFLKCLFVSFFFFFFLKTVWSEENCQKFQVVIKIKKSPSYGYFPMKASAELLPLHFQKLFLFCFLRKSVSS